MSESTGGLPIAGWYDDPLTPGGRRYWDGGAWTESVQAPTAPDAPGSLQDGPPVGGNTPPVGPAGFGTGPGTSVPLEQQPFEQQPFEQPPFDPLPPGASATGGSGNLGDFAPAPAGGKINDLGDWLGRTFSVIFANWQPLAILSLIAFPLWAVVLLLAHQAVGAISIDTDSGDFSGVNVPLVIAAVALTFVAIVASLISFLAVYHNLFGAHIGRQVTWSKSLQVGLSRQPRFIGLAALVYGATYLALGIPIAVVAFGFVGSSDVNITLLLLGVTLGFAAVLFLIWFWVKIGAFFPVAAAVVPRGTSAIGACRQVSRNRFWPVLARVGIIYALATTASTVAQTVSQALGPAVLFSKFEFAEPDTIRINGVDIENIEILQLSDVLPNPIGLLVYLSLIWVASAGSQLITASAVAALYADAKAPHSFDR